MKRTTLILGCILAIGCTSQETKDIEASAKGYLQAMGNYQMDEAAPYASRHTREQTIPMLKHIMSNTDTAYINANRPAVITIARSKRLTDSTARVYYHKHTPIKEVDDSVTLVLEEGHWLVDVRLAPMPFGIGASRDSLHRITNIPSPSEIRKNTTPVSASPDRAQ